MLYEKLPFGIIVCMSKRAFLCVFLRVYPIDSLSKKENQQVLLQLNFKEGSRENHARTSLGRFITEET